MRRELSIRSDGSPSDPWPDQSPRPREEDQEPSKVGWYSEKAIYSEREWRKKYRSSVVQDPFRRYAIIAFGGGRELTAIGLRSEYLKDLYYRVADYIPDITIESDMIVLG